MTTYTPPRRTLRQTRLYAWMCDPQGDFCRKPEHGHDWKAAAWNAGELVRLTGIYPDKPDPRRACLADLDALTKRGKLMKLGTSGANLRWMVAGPSW